MKSRRTALLMIGFALLAAGCGSSRYTVIEPPKESVRDFKILEIRDFKSNLQDEDSIRLADNFADRLNKAVQEDRAEHPGESIFEQVVRGDSATGDVLVLDGTIISFEKGSRAKRYFIGFGAGKAFCTIQSTFTNKSTGQEILKTNFDGELSMSFFGGSADEAVDAVVAAYIDYLRDYFAKTSAK
ncbi:MAG: DUF4410 domain-containing protein [Steroidobacteraceae bacterium]|nr:DUF4410 domain-containing protein [Steroidobacteraceae bacterium]